MAGACPLLPTSLAGSYPQPEWLIDRRMLSKRMPPRVRAGELWRVAPEWLEQAQDDATILAIRDQERAGLDILTDGEIRRESYSNRFATALCTRWRGPGQPGNHRQPQRTFDPCTSRRGTDPAQAAGSSTGPEVPACQYGPPGQDHCARALHDVATGCRTIITATNKPWQLDYAGRRQRRNQGTCSRRAPITSRSTNPTCRPILQKPANMASMR